MIEPFNFNGNWILVKGMGQSDTSQIITGSSRHSIPPTMAFRECWAEHGWVPNGPLAKKFATREEAVAYLKLNGSAMEAMR